MPSLPAVSADRVSAAELIGRARALGPAIRERRVGADEQRRLPPETVEDFKQAGFIRMLMPRRFGGLEHGHEVLAEVAIEIGRACGASGWLVSFLAMHNFQVGWFPLEAQEEYWATGPNTLSSTVPLYRTMTREVVDGGLRISGRASFSSGVDYADWTLVHTTEEVCLVPRSDFRIIDDWHVSGLRGTGSKSVEIDDVFVPAHRIVSNASLFEGTYPGAALYGGDNPWYRVPHPTVLGIIHAIVAPVIGMARGVIDIFDERVRNRLDGQSFLPARERPGPQLRFAEACAEVDAADMFMRANMARARALGEGGAKPSLEERALVRRDSAYAAKLLLQSTNRLVDGMDAAALHEKSPLHRQARDVRAGCLQFNLHWEETAMQFARVHWGLEPQTPLI